MARTAHHIATDLADAFHRRGAPLRLVTLTDLRYGSALLRAARQEGRRPRPQAVRRSVRVHHWARFDVRDRSVGADAAFDERRARQRLRRGLARLTAHRDPEADITPARHRHNARWLF
ncbi:hypothetical protein OG871_11505 [Kitasatospora sp. NBC_00374]|uniref:hypothetical protein n=1 Tax=Kitasatospora sp. NBC_00374 TaxID=2975964 RepID=UPI0030E57A35